MTVLHAEDRSAARWLGAGCRGARSRAAGSHGRPGGRRTAGALGCLLPAPVNLHSPCLPARDGGDDRSGAAPGRTVSGPGATLMYRFLDRLTPEDVEAIAALVHGGDGRGGLSPPWRSSTTCITGRAASPYADRAEMSARIAAAAAETGLGLTLLPVLYEQGGCDGRALTAGQLRFGNDPDGYARAVGGRGAGAGRVCRMTRCWAWRRIRCARSAGDSWPRRWRSRRTRRCTSTSPNRWPKWPRFRPPMARGRWSGCWRTSAVDARWCLIHCTQMTAGRDGGAGARPGRWRGFARSPRRTWATASSTGCGSLAAGGRWGVGSDSNVRISLAEELRLLEYSQRLRDRGRAMLADGGQVNRAGAVRGRGRRAGRRRRGARRARSRWATGPTLLALDMASCGSGGAGGRCDPRCLDLRGRRPDGDRRLVGRAAYRDAAGGMSRARRDRRARYRARDGAACGTRSDDRAGRRSAPRCCAASGRGTGRRAR